MIAMPCFVSHALHLPNIWLFYYFGVAAVWEINEHDVRAYQWLAVNLLASCIGDNKRGRAQGRRVTVSSVTNISNSWNDIVRPRSMQHEQIACACAVFGDRDTAWKNSPQPGQSDITPDWKHAFKRALSVKPIAAVLFAGDKTSLTNLMDAGNVKTLTMSAFA